MDQPTIIMNMEPTQIGELIKSVINRANTEPNEKTIMSIAGISHLENIWSNLYAFFLDERESHGLGTLFLKSLEHIIKKYTEKSVSLSGSIIKREQTTIGGNRIDILIEAPRVTVLIENKVHHQLDNDLDDYWLSIPRANENKIGIVLTLTHINVCHPCYFNVTHLELVKEIEFRLISNKISPNSKAMILLNDFISNVKQVSKKMNEDNVKFYLENRIQINTIHSVVSEYRDWLQSVFTDRAFIRSLGDFSLVHNDWIGSKHRFAMYKILDGKNGELVITVFYEWLWNSCPGSACLNLYLQPLGEWFDMAIIHEERIRSIAETNGVPSMDKHKDFWHCANVTIPVPEVQLQNENELKKHLMHYLSDPYSGLMRAAKEVGELLSKSHTPSYKWKDAVTKLDEIVIELEDKDVHFLISQIDFKLYDSLNQIVVLEVTDNLIRYDIERYLDRELLRAIEYAYGKGLKYSILCRQLMF